MGKTFLKTIIILSVLLLLSNCTTNETKTDTLQLTLSAASSVTTTTANVNVSITNGGSSNITAKGICWSTSPNPTISLNTKTIDGTGTSSFNSILSELIPGTTYYIRAYATNSSGTVYSVEITFATTAVNLKTGLVAYYPFSGNANDTSGNNNNGIVNGATLTTNRFGNINSAYSFNGINNYIQCNPISQITNIVSISLWTKNKRDSNGSEYRCLITNQPNTSEGFLLQDRKTDLKYSFSVANGSNYFDCISSTPFVFNQWEHLVAIISNNQIKIYKNSKLESTQQISGNYILSSNSNLLIGSRFIKEYFLGDLDEITIWNRALNQDEIIALYNGQNP